MTTVEILVLLLPTACVLVIATVYLVLSGQKRRALFLEKQKRSNREVLEEERAKKSEEVSTSSKSFVTYEKRSRATSLDSKEDQASPQLPLHSDDPTSTLGAALIIQAAVDSGPSHSSADYSHDHSSSSSDYSSSSDGGYDGGSGGGEL